MVEKVTGGQFANDLARLLTVVRAVGDGLLFDAVRRDTLAGWATAHQEYVTR